MVHEKDAELDAHKRKETEAAALMKSLVCCGKILNLHIYTI